MAAPEQSKSPSTSWWWRDDPRWLVDWGVPAHRDAAVAAVVEAVNRARQNPSEAAAALREAASWFTGNVMASPLLPVGKSVKTEEGAAAVEDAAAALAAAASTAAVELQRDLSGSSQLLADDSGAAGGTSNTLGDGTAMADRIGRFGDWTGRIVELLGFGSFGPKDAVLSWLIDDGNATRRNRKALLDADWRVLGIGLAPHKSMRNELVVALAAKFTAKGSGSASGAAAATSESARAAVAASAASSASSAPSSSAPSSSSSSASSSSASAAAMGVAPGASQLQESADGNSFVVKAGATDLPRDRLRLERREATSLTLVRLAEDQQTVVATKTWQLPFVIRDADAVDARYDAATTELTLHLLRPRGEDAPAAAAAAATGNGGKRVVGSLQLAGGGGSGKQLDFGVAQDAEAFRFRVTQQPEFATAVEAALEPAGASTKLVLTAVHREPVTVGSGPNDTQLKTVTGTFAFNIPFLIDRAEVQPDANTIVTFKPANANAAAAAQQLPKIEIPIR